MVIDYNNIPSDIGSEKDRVSASLKETTARSRKIISQALKDISDISDNLSISKDRMRFLLTFAYNYRNCMHDSEELARIILYTLSGNTPDKEITFPKAIKAMWKQVLEQYDLLAFDQSVWLAGGGEYDQIFKAGNAAFSMK